MLGLATVIAYAIRSGFELDRMGFRKPSRTSAIWIGFNAVFTDVNGVRQGMFIKGRDAKHPVAMAEFSRVIPAARVFIANLLRGLVFVLPFAMPLEVMSQSERRALWVFVLGTLVHSPIAPCHWAV